MKKKLAQIRFIMGMDYSTKKVKEESLEDIEDFVRANLHYLSKKEQRLFHTIDRIAKLNDSGKKEKTCYESPYSGKS